MIPGKLHVVWLGQVGVYDLLDALSASHPGSTVDVLHTKDWAGLGRTDLSAAVRSILDQSQALLTPGRCLLCVDGTAIHATSLCQPWLHAFLADPGAVLAKSPKMSMFVVKHAAVAAVMAHKRDDDITSDPWAEAVLIPDEVMVPREACDEMAVLPELGPAEAPRTAMRLLVLVIATKDTGMYAAFTALWRRMAECTAVQVYLLYADKDLATEVHVDEEAHEIWCRCEENLHVGVYTKTCMALQYLSERSDWPSWSAVLRTNLSSMFHWARTLDWLRLFAHPRTLRLHPQFAGGILGRYSDKLFVSGAGTFWSPEVAQKLRLMAPPAHVTHDDVTLTTRARALEDRLVCVRGHRQDDLTEPMLFHPGQFHARCKNRPDKAKMLVDALYPRPRWTHVAVACNTVPKYARCLPWCVRAWLRIGVLPVVGLVGFSESMTEALHLPRECIIVHIPVPEGATDLRTAFIAQNVRPYLAAWAAPLHAVTLLCDADMMPIRGAYFHGRAVPSTPRSVSILRWVSPAKTQVAMCYVGTHTAAWRGLYPEEDYTATLSTLWETLGPTYGVPGKGRPLHNWFHDQETLTRRILDSAAAGTVLLESHTDEELRFRRLCRSNVGPTRSLQAAPLCTDYHMIRDGGDVDSAAAYVLAHVQ